MDSDHCETCGAKLTTRQALRSSSSARVSRHLTDKRQCYACRQKELERRKRYCETCGVKLTAHNRSLNYKGRCHACGRKEFERRKEEIAQGSEGAIVSAIVSPDAPPPPPSPTTWHLPSTPPSEPRRASEKRYYLGILLGVLVLIALAAVATGFFSHAPTSPQLSSSSDYVALNVNSVATSSKLGNAPLQSTPSAGNVYVIYDVTLTNQNKNDLYIGNPLYFTLKSSDGTAYQYSPSSVWLENYLTGVSHTNPGDKVTGKIAFEIPQSARPSELSYGDGFNGVVTVNL
jgi:hypothetical protein